MAVDGVMSDVNIAGGSGFAYPPSAANHSPSLDALGNNVCKFCFGYFGNCLNCTSGCTSMTIYYSALRNFQLMRIRWTYRILHDLLHHSIVWSSDDSNDLIQLIVVVSSSEDWYTRDHLGKAVVLLSKTRESDALSKLGNSHPVLVSFRPTHIHPALQISILVL